MAPKAPSTAPLAWSVTVYATDLYYFVLQNAIAKCRKLYSACKICRHSAGSANLIPSIAFLDRARANQDANVVTIVAWAGVGKSTLVNHWLRRMAAKHYRSAELIFGWSF
jgi:hypothetical protein